MSLTIIEGRAAIEAAVATMHPIASDAAKDLANRMLANLVLVHDMDALHREFQECLTFAYVRAGKDPAADVMEFKSFIENHGQSVLNVSVSIVRFVRTSAERRKKWGWLGKAAAVAAGVALGSFFG